MKKCKTCSNTEAVNRLSCTGEYIQLACPDCVARIVMVDSDVLYTQPDVYVDYFDFKIDLEGFFNFDAGKINWSCECDGSEWNPVCPTKVHIKHDGIIWAHPRGALSAMPLGSIWHLRRFDRSRCFA